MTLPGLEGAAVAVVGAGGGIGAAVVAGLQLSGARPYALDRAKFCHLPEPNPGIPFIACDLACPGSVEEALDAVVASAGRLDGLVNAAGITQDRTLLKMSEEEWSSVLDVNLTGSFRALQAAARRMKEHRHGSIVNIASINGPLRGKFGQANYTASKAGLVALTRTAARELGPSGIRVNALAPGMVLTPMTRSLPPRALDEALRQTCLSRLADPADIAGPVLFLLSDLARHITGHLLVVDGGQTA